ncbi:glycosyltransferase [Verrucomicrobiota bacterium]
MTIKSGKRLIVFGAVTAVIIVLIWPTGTWLQGRELHLKEGVVPDAVYLVAGSGEQDRRIDAVVNLVSSLKSPVLNIKILVGNDTLKGGWSSEHQRNLTMAERAVVKLKTLGHIEGEDIEIVPGKFWGTDGEMQALAEYLKTHREIRDLTVVTSPFHIRRAVWRLKTYLSDSVSVFAAAPISSLYDRMPWRVLGELAKMSRDVSGLSDAPFLSRKFYMTQGCWLSVILLFTVIILAYTWLGYPLLLAAIARRRMVNDQIPEKVDIESVAILLSAYNEESVIKQRLENLLSSSASIGVHPAFARKLRRTGRRLNILIGTDGCTDRTAEIARAFAENHDNIHIHEFKERRGKVAVLKELVKECNRRWTSSDPLNPMDPRGPMNADATKQILVFTDANTMFRPDALEKLLRHFDDPKIGGVCGRLIFKENQSVTGCRLQVTGEENIYWKWEARLKERESALDSCLGANGAIYAIRRELFWKEIPDNTIVDDFVIGMKVREQGFRVIYEPEAIAEEGLPETADEWARRVRIGAGDYQALSLCGKCLSVKYGRFAWIFFSHKVLRWLTPHMLMFLVLGSWFLVFQEFFKFSREIAMSSLALGLGTFTAAFTVIFILCAMLGELSKNNKAYRFFHLCYYFLTMQVALFVGFLRYCRGNLKGHWTRTPRKN